MELRKPFHYDVAAASAAAQTFVSSETKTQQQDRDAADINQIVRRFGLTGQLPRPKSLPEYGDFSAVIDFQGAMQELRRSTESFQELPALVRDRFSNDPSKFMLFLQDPDNVDEARKLGLLPKKPSVPPVAVVEPVASPEEPPPAP